MESKKQELNKIEERNERIVEIATELGEKIELFQASLDPSELPESVLHVSDSQITATKYVANDKAQNAGGGGSNGPDAYLIREYPSKQFFYDPRYDRALRVMMGGGLDAKAQQPLEEELVRPSWMDKPEADMSEEEIKELRAFEKKVETMKEEKEKARRALETELKKLQLQVQ